MHRSIGVILFLIVSVLVPRQARSIEPVTVTLATATIIGGVASGLDLIDRVKAWNSLVESNSSKLNGIRDKDLRGAKKLMEQYNNTPSNKKLLEDARTRFTLSAGVYEGRLDGTDMYKQAVSWLGVKMCCDVSNDRANAQMALVKIAKIGLLPESADDKKREPDYLKYVAVWEAVMANLTNTKVYDRNKVWELANKYLVGKGGVVKDEAGGFKLMQVVATQGSVGAQYNVGKCYKDGVGVKRNYSGAAYWYRKAAEQGHSRARSELGNLYLNGRGVPKNVIEGTAWAALSSMNEASKYNIRISGVTLSSGDKIKVQKRVSELFKKYGKTK